MLKIEEIRALPMVASANQWKDRIYINLVHNGRNFRGDRNSKVWMRADGELMIERAKGLTSSDWEASLAALQVTFAN